MKLCNHVSTPLACWLGKSTDNKHHGMTSNYEAWAATARQSYIMLTLSFYKITNDTVNGWHYCQVLTILFHFRKMSKFQKVNLVSSNYCDHRLTNAILGVFVSFFPHGHVHMANAKRIYPINLLIMCLFSKLINQVRFLNTEASGVKSGRQRTAPSSKWEKNNI